MIKVKFGIVGTGMIARFHAEALKHCENAELFIVYDKVPALADKFASEYNCKKAHTLEELFSSGVEALTIGTPSGFHGSVAVAAANAGKHILCEKPLETTVEKTDEILRACEKNKVRIAAVFQARFSKAVEVIKKAVDDGRFGTPVLASASVRWYRTPEYYASNSWRGTWALDGGGALMNQGIHTVDLILHFNGDVSEVTGHTANILHKKIEVEDTVAAVVKFKNNSLGIIEASTACDPGFPRRVELSGTCGSVVLEDDRIVRWKFKEPLPGDDEILRECARGEGMHGGSGDPNAISWEGHRRQIFELADSIQKGTPLKMPGSEGRRAVALICAVYESAKNKKTVVME